jgi:RNA polymerase sigma-70 factor (ECF subfamily)
VQLEEHLFRREAGRMIAALTRIFGVQQLALAEDVVQDAFCRALEVWTVRGLPDNPAAWLMTAAKNRAFDILRRQQTARRLEPEIVRQLEAESMPPSLDEAFAAPVIRDGQLRMMFSCCDPALAEEAQVAMILNVLCGFGASEIAAALLTRPTAIRKRIERARKTLAQSEQLFDLADSEFANRLSTVRRALYLLFNEGYHGASAKGAVRADLCAEAIGLVRLLLEYLPAATPETCALAALMCLHGARLPARIDASGSLNQMADQDRTRWDRALLAEGLTYFDRSAAGQHVSAYHLEAAIAATHAAAPTLDATDWPTIVELYDRLLALSPSPVVALNRAVAIAERDGPDRGLDALGAIDDSGRLAEYPFYAAARGELELRRGNRAAARAHFAEALRLARNDDERKLLDARSRAAAAAAADHADLADHTTRRVRRGT